LKAAIIDCHACDRHCDPKTTECRDCLVTKHFRWAERKATSIARHMRFRDPENAIGDALATFALEAIPRYQPGRDIRTWLASCVRRSLISSHRHELCDRTRTIQNPEHDWTHDVPAREERSVEPIDFSALAQFLTARQAEVLRLRHQAGLSIADIAAKLGIKPRLVKYDIHESHIAIREHHSLRESPRSDLKSEPGAPFGQHLDRSQPNRRTARTPPAPTVTRANRHGGSSPADSASPLPPRSSTT
jgi:RNA polymerase sigma factor (sigma-70 family)